jgi:ubiquinone/menaquinone biosynthesis C-methylase UbiE
MSTIAPANEEAVAAWDGVLFDRFLQYRHIFTTGLGEHGNRAMELYPPPKGGRVLDIGCGFGDTTQQLAALVGPAGQAVGIDSSERFIEKSIEEADEAGVENVRFLVGDVQATELDERFDHAFSRMGTMFFANPVQALRNVRQALEPGSTLCMVVWRRKMENEWVSRAEEIVERFIAHPDPEDSDEPTCGPGPFSMANADTVSMQLMGAGFEDIAFHRSDIPMVTGHSVDEAIEVVTALGPAAEIIRLAGEEGEKLRPQIEAELRTMIEANYLGDDGVVRGPASCWIVAARAAG